MPAFKTPFHAHSTALETLGQQDLRGKNVVVTGGASGIGIETVRALAKAGACVTLAVRRVEAAKSVMEEIIRFTGNQNLLIEELDLSSLPSVRAFVRRWRGPLHILINNAGVMALPELTRSAGGHEMQFATNHLGHFSLALGLHGALSEAGREGGARVVCVSSSANMLSPVIFDDIHYRFRPYDAIGAYAQSKTAVILFAVEAARRWAQDGICVNALNPGAIVTPLQRHLPPDIKVPKALEKTPQQGAATSVLLAASPLLEGISGRYFEDCNEATRMTERKTLYHGVAPYALCPENARRLWDRSVDMLRYP